MTSLPCKQFYIFGQEIAFSMSPTIHNAAFKHHSLPHTYQIRETRTTDELSDNIASSSLGGASVIIPHKQSIINYCTSLSLHAESIGAVNTLVSILDAESRQIIGYNTNWSGLISCLRSKNTDILEYATTALVIGAGGSSRAALYALYQLGIKNIMIVNRTRSTAEKTVSDYASLFTTTVFSALADITERPHIIIGTIPADCTGTEYFPDALFGHEQGICVDMAYKPRETPLLRVAKRHEGWVRITGVEVLLEQGFEQSELWLQRPAPRTIIMDALERRDRMDDIESKVAVQKL